MAKSKNNYIDFELQWLETKASELKQYIDNRPLHLLVDRMAYKETKAGGVIPVIIATIEAQRADISKAVKDYAEITSSIANLRERESKKVEVRGGRDLPGVLSEGDDE